MVESRIDIPCGAITLVGRMSVSRKRGAPAVLLMHPHPLYGGDMDSSVIEAATVELAGRGCSTLRFNFRGTGGSGGVHSGGPLEVQDALAALAVLRGAARTAGRLCMLGYSFGAYVAASSLEQAAGIDRVVLFAPPTVWGHNYLPRKDIPILIIAGDRDHVCDTRKWEERARGDSAITMHTFTGESHFFANHLPDAVAMAADFIMLDR